MISISGGCLCGKIRYTVKSLPISQGICFCHQCKKTGSIFGSSLMVLHKKTFEYVQNVVSFYETKSDSGSTVRRHFCKECGSHVFSEISDVPDIITLKAATLDDLSLFAPQFSAWTKSASIPSSVPSDIPSFDENVPLEIVLGLKQTV